MSRTTILGSETAPLMVLEEHDIGHINFSAAQQELLRYIKEQAGESCTWGYFPELEEDDTAYPACRKLALQLEKQFLAKLKQPPGAFQLAFVRMATSKPVSQHGGMHLDVAVGVGHKRDPAISREQEIVRVLVNFSDTPRVLRYCAHTRDELAKQGVKLSTEHYEALQLPANTLRTIAIPPMQGTSVSCLIFWSSLLAHEGVTDEHGHFMAAYGAHADPKQYTL
jgi:hypothetical protein